MKLNSQWRGFDTASMRIGAAIARYSLHWRQLPHHAHVGLPSVAKLGFPSSCTRLLTRYYVKPLQYFAMLTAALNARMAAAGDVEGEEGGKRSGGVLGALQSVTPSLPSAPVRLS